MRSRHPHRHAVRIDRAELARLEADDPALAFALHRMIMLQVSGKLVDNTRAMDSALRWSRPPARRVARYAIGAMCHAALGLAGQRAEDADRTWGRAAQAR